MKKYLALVLALVMALSLVACGNKTAEEPSDDGDATEAAGRVFWLNFKPEADGTLQKVAAMYTEKTGVPVTIQTAASGTYNETLTAAMDKEAPPTMFGVGNQAAVDTWGDYCYDLSGTAVANELNTDAYNLYDADGKLCSIGYCYECYGIIVNEDLLAKAGYQLSDITNFETLKAVAEDIHSRAAELGFDAFTSSSMSGDSSWRFTGHLANLEYYYESVDDPDAWKVCPPSIKGTYMQNFKNLWDLYINNATCKPTELSTKTADDATADFVTGDAVFYQNGTWEYNNIKDVGDDNLGILPIYIGVEGEEDQGICTGTENYWCVNSKASEDDIQATLDFMNWCVTSDDGVKAMCKDMGFTIPFKKNLKSDNVLVNEANKYTEDGKTPVSWNFSTMPSEEWKNGVGSALTSYAADPTDANWAKVTTAFVDGWAKEAAAAK